MKGILVIYKRRSLKGIFTEFTKTRIIRRRKPELSLSLSRSLHAIAEASLSPLLPLQMVSFYEGLLYGIGGLTCTCLLLLVAFQEKLVYVPVVPGLTRRYTFTPARLRLIYEDVWLTASDRVRLHCWFVKVNPNCTGLDLHSVFRSW